MDSGNLSQTADKLELIASVLSDMGYDAVGVGAMDLRLGADFFKHTSEKNLVVLDAAPGANESTVPYVVKDVGGTKVGIISFGAVAQDVDWKSYEVRKSVYSAYKSARDESDILILLDQVNFASKQWLEANGARLGAPDLVVGGVAKSGLAEAELIGDTMIGPTSVQGKYVGVVEFEDVPGQSWRKSAQKIKLDSTFPEDEEVAKRVDETMLEIKKASGVVVSAQNRTSFGSREPYYSPNMCKGCHVKQYEQWEASKHAKAIATLSRENRLVPECLPCHAEMYRAQKRTIIPRDGIGGVECATCHKDAIPHGAERKDVAEKTKVDPALCVDCHTKERSPKYDERTYFPKITH